MGLQYLETHMDLQFLGENLEVSKKNTIFAKY